MTLILTALNERCVVQVSDRRLTSNGKLVDDEANKAIALTLPDARLSVAFTGLARAGSFDTRDWLMEAIHRASKDEGNAPALIERVADTATRTFKETPSICSTAPQNRRLDIVFAGYGLLQTPPILFHAQVSNLMPDGTIGDFQVDAHLERRPNEGPLSMLYSGGFDTAWEPEDGEVIRSAMDKLVSPDDLVSVLHNRMVKIADRAASKGMIGKQFDSIIIERDGGPIRLGYESDVIKAEMHAPASITIHGPGQGIMVKDMKIWTDVPGAAFKVPRVHRNAPCPCGSGKRYRECHRPSQASSSSVLTDIG